MTETPTAHLASQGRRAGESSRAAEDRGLSAESRALSIWSTAARRMSPSGIGFAGIDPRKSAIHSRSSAAACGCVWLYLTTFLEKNTGSFCV